MLIELLAINDYPDEDFTLLEYKINNALIHTEIQGDRLVLEGGHLMAFQHHCLRGDWKKAKCIIDRALQNPEISFPHRINIDD